MLAHKVPELANYESVRPEVKYGTNSRIDFLLSGEGRKDLYLEVKSVTLSREESVAEFPDSVTARGTKHLEELMAMIDQGHEAMMLYLVQRTDAERVTLAPDIDPTYAATFQRARAAGVQVLAYGCDISPTQITIGAPLPFAYASQ